MPQGKISDEAWSAQKDVIVTLFVEQDVTLDQLVSIMHDKGFQASKGQLARHLKNWKVSKNLSERQWKTAIKIIKRRERDSRQSEFWFRDRRLPLAKVRKAIQRYDLPRLRLSGVPSPSPEPMADIRVCTPPRSPSIETTLVRQSALRLDGLDGANRHPFPRGIILDGLPFLQFRQKLEESASLWLPRGSMQIWGGQILQNILPVIGNLSDTKPWQSIPEVVSNFPIPLRTLDSSSDSNSYLWLIEFMVIGSTNGLLRPCRDRTLDLLIDTMNEVEVLDQVLALIGRYEFYGIIEKILDLGTISSALFGARALLSSIALEDERLLEILLSRGVPLDGTRNRSCMSAIHLAVEQQNEKIIRRLLKAGIDPDGYTISDDDQNKPLSDLLFLFSIKKDYRVTQISQAIVDLILLSRSNVYSAEECASYWTLLFLQSWVYDATQFLDALCNHYHRSATLDVGVLCKTHFPPITEEEDFNDIAHKILVHVPLPEHEHLGPVDWLMGAIRRRDLSIVEILRHRYPDAWLDSLLGDSFDEDAINWLLQSPIDVSMKLGNFFLTKNGANTTDKWLNYVTTRGGEIDEHLIKGLPCARCVFRKESSGCMQPMAVAVSSGNVDLVKDMIWEGFEVGRMPCVAKVPLISAIDEERLDFVQILLQAEADVNLRNYSLHRYGETSLCLAVRRQRLDLIQVLLQAGADINIPRYADLIRDKASALELACSMGEFNIVCSLLEAVADPHDGTWLGGPLSRAAKFGHLDIVHLLLANCHNTRAIKKACKKAALWAREAGHQNCIARMLEQRAQALADQIGIDDSEDDVDEEDEMVAVIWSD
ncbi:hypothetical protein MMC10_003549 [Thelotrema lepadinum]|nr:hypothetical protein [Thelotrema lepadinum]